MKTPRSNPTKAQVAQIALQQAEQKKHIEDVERQKTLVKEFWPFIAEGLTIYDAQTVANAVSGFIKYEVEKKQDELKVSDLLIDVSNEKDTAIKEAMQKVLEVFKNEKAIDSAQLLERFGKTLGMYSAHTYMKQNMSILDVKDIVA